MVKPLLMFGSTDEEKQLADESYSSPVGFCVRQEGRPVSSVPSLGREERALAPWCFELGGLSSKLAFWKALLEKLFIFA